jgi:Zn-dependent protease
MMNGIRIGRVFGIDIAIHPSWFVIFGLFTFSLATGFFPRAYSSWSPAEAWIVAAVATILLFVSVLAHELGHSLVARAQGIPVRNITLFLLGGVSTLEKEATSPGREALMAGVGPLVSLVIGLVSWAAAYLVPAHQHAQAVLLYLGLANVTLAVFNLLPGFPLDGGRILRALLWWRSHDLVRATRGAATVGQVVGYVFIALGVLQILGRSPFGGLWLGFIGWVIIQGSRAGAAQSVMRRDLAGATASRIMTEPAGWLRPFVTLSSAAQHGFRQPLPCRGARGGGPGVRRADLRPRPGRRASARVGRAPGARRDGPGAGHPRGRARYPGAGRPATHADEPRRPYRGYQGGASARLRRRDLCRPLSALARDQATASREPSHGSLIVTTAQSSASTPPA